MTELDHLAVLEAFLAPHIDRSFPLHSRCHLMRSSPLYVKRDDELGLVGSKLRKYVSLLPYIKKEQKTVAIVGSAYSNHTLFFTQYLRQAGLPYHLFLEKPKTTSIEGNFFFLSLLLTPDRVTWLDKVPEVISVEWLSTFEEKLQKPLFVVPMGGCMPQALLGALTLSTDLVRNEQELSLQFNHIFVDAGTGVTAAGLLLGLSFMERKIPVTCVLMAGKEEQFHKTLQGFHQFLEKSLGFPTPLPTNYRCLYPTTGKSFGSCNATIFQTVKTVAEEEGIFLDPLYSSKLYLTAKKESLSGNVLWIHSGGTLTLTGFYKDLTKRLVARPF